MSTDPKQAHGLSRRSLLTAGGVALAGSASGVALGRPADAATRTTRVQTTDLGTAVRAFTVVGTAFDGSLLYLGSRNFDPAVIAAYDPPTRTVTSNVELPTARGFVQGMTTFGSTIYAGTSSGSRDDFWRYDTATGETALVTRTPLIHIRELASAPDGKIYLAGIPTDVYEYDPATDQLRNLGVTDPDAGQVSALAATETMVYVGSGSLRRPTGHANLVAIDRASGEMTVLTPPEFTQDSIVYWLKVSGNLLLAGTTGHQPCRMAVINLDDPADYRIVRPIDSTMYGPFERVGDTVYFVTYYGTLWSYQLGTGEITELATPQPYVRGQALVHAGGLLTCPTFVSAWSYDLASGETFVQDLAAAGAESRAQEAQSIAASDREVYVAGTGVVGVRDVLTGDYSTLATVPGEAKDMTFVGKHRHGALFLAAYGSATIWRYDPRRDDQPRLAAQMPTEQNRPRHSVYDDRNDLLLVTTRMDSQAPLGALVVFDPDTGDVRTHVDPLGTGSTPNALAIWHGVAYVGEDEGLVAAWDPVAGHELWRLRSPAGTAVTGLAAAHHRLYCLTRDAEFFVVDLKTRRVVNWQRFPGLGSGPRLTAAQHAVYGSTTNTLFRIDPWTYDFTVLINGLSGDWYGGRQKELAVGSDDTIYVLKERNVLRVREL